MTAKSQIKPRANEPIAKFLARITHLHLNDRKLTSSALPAGCCPGLKALYLFDNVRYHCPQPSQPRPLHRCTSSMTLQPCSRAGD